MQIVSVKSAQDIREFLAFPNRIYQNDPHWIRPLDKDIEAVFDKDKNKFFKHGECERWLLKDDNHETIARCASFVNKKYLNDQPTGGIGFFECIDSQEAANFLLDHCKKWLQERGMEAMDGPINFGERDRWWGLQIEGFQEPLYCMNYNPPYYKTLFENYGFHIYFNQICFGFVLKTQLDEKFYLRHAQLSEDKNYRCQRLRKKDLTKYVKDFTYIYNKAWAGHGGGKELEERTVQKMFEKMKPVIDEDLIWFTYYKEEPIALFLNLPDLNQYFKYFNGKFGLWQKLQFLWLKYFGKCDRFVGLVFGIIPEFQGKGIDSFMIVETAKVVQASKQYSQYEMQWVGDFNPKMLNIAESIGATVTRKLATYRYLFDRNKEFIRHPSLAKEK
ncbi:MAG TPA: hypothetical protein PLQ78_02160 [Flavipsychrobacter sp.]|nr:hypothetical protein [Flavipsychrobacter sp.]